MCLHPSCQISHFHSFFSSGLPWCVAAPSVVDATFALLVPFGAVLLHIMINGRLFVVINTCPPACRLQAVISHSFLLAGLTHLYVTVKFKSPKQGSCLRSWCTGLWRLEVFAQVLVCEGSTLLWRSHLHDMFKSCTLRRYQDFRLGCIFFLFLFSLVLSVNSPNATSLHSRCIWEGVLEYNSQG